MHSKLLAVIWKTLNRPILFSYRQQTTLKSFYAYKFEFLVIKIHKTSFKWVFTAFNVIKTHKSGLFSLFIGFFGCF